MAETVTLHVKVVPHASRDELSGWMGDALKVRVTAAPERGKANAAVVELIAAALAMPQQRVRIVGGATHARKRLAISGVTKSELRAALDAALEYNRAKR